MANLQHPFKGKDIFKRHHVKPDGRNLYLYGYQEHKLPVITGENLDQVVGSELRQHPLRGDWSIYAAKRQHRTFKPSTANNPLAPSRVGAPITEIPFEDYDLAVFENRFPGMYRGANISSDQPLEIKTAQGVCEVLVYSPKEEGSLATIGQDKRRLLLAAWIDRYQDLYSTGNAFVLPFENRGEAVGVTLHHPHGQIYAFPVVPEPQQRALKAFEDGYNLAAELTTWPEELIIAKAGGMVAYAPPFARFPYEVWISGINHHSGPWAFNTEQADGFCHLLGEMSQRYDAFFGRETPYMLTLHASPYGHDNKFQFSAQFYPLLRSADRLKYLAAVEQATNIFTVDVMPETTAADLKGAL